MSVRTTHASLALLSPKSRMPGRSLLLVLIPPFISCSMTLLPEAKQMQKHAWGPRSGTDTMGVALGGSVCSIRRCHMMSEIIE